ncbi:MAG: hypothetical protein LBQ13_02910 [Endomicrobium sp.]|jgi:hypothetical protein|nr:hypothetical protein [Endomicrobium sp.]
MGVLFSADLSQDVEFFISTTPTDVDRKYNVYEVYLGSYPTENTYWTDWGGYYDNPIVNKIELYIDGRFLVSVYSLEDCCETPYSIYDEPSAGTVYFNLPKHPWLYDDIGISTRKSISFLSGPKNPNNPSDNKFNNESWPVRLDVPKFTVKLSDVINGLTKYSTFDFTLYNNDGYFDDLEITNFFNSPSYIKKTWKENPQAGDFIPIRYGMVETIKIDDKTMTVSCADIFRTLEEPVSRVVSDLFPVAIENQDEELPIIYGTVRIPLIKITDTMYVAGENITSVSDVYDKDGNPASYTFLNGIITSNIEIESALATGNTNNRIGQIVVDLIISKTNITYINSFWDVNETNEYVNNSPAINIAFIGGSVREAVKDALMSDMVFLIQKNDGRFTLRQWGKQYNNFIIDKKLITKFPSKHYADAQKNYFSSCLIKYNFDYESDEYENVLLFKDYEENAETLYNKVVKKEFETNLTSSADALSLAVNLSDRFTTLRETIQVAVGYNTSEINLLDTIEIELNINKRIFSRVNKWIVKEIDPAQDVLTLEPFIENTN